MDGSIAIVDRFEASVDALVNGDLAALRAALQEEPELVRARSGRPHRCTLLHYVAANGVEDERQKAPANGVEIARTLLEAGAEVDALAPLYGVECTTMSLLVSSCHPAAAGTQVPLVELLLDFGAAIEGVGTRKWGGPLMTALSFGYLDAARALVRRGAKVDVVSAAGMGIVDSQLLEADEESRQRAFALAAQHAQVAVVRMLLDAGEDPNRYNLEGNHAHSTPLHQAVLTGNEEVVRLLVERGARLDIRDRIYEGTALGWAIYGGGKRSAEMAALLRSLGATD